MIPGLVLMQSFDSLSWMLLTVCLKIHKNIRSITKPHSKIDNWRQRKYKGTNQILPMPHQAWKLVCYELFSLVASVALGSQGTLLA